jgi:hypothetical protein
MHGLTPDGLDVIEDVLDIISLFAYHSEERINAKLWELYPMMLHICCGTEGEVDGGFAFEFLQLTVLAVQNFIGKDKETL